MLDSELIGLEQRGQASGSEKLHTIQIHNHDPRHGKLGDQEISQFQPGRGVDLAFYRDHPGAGSALDHLHTEASGIVVAHRHARHDILRAPGSATWPDQSC